MALFVAGCGGASDQPDLGTVSGVVTLDGQPLPNATVKFVPESGRSSVGVTDANGYYELQYTNESAGAKVGPHAVSITTQSAAYSNEGGGGGTASTAEQIPPQYNERTILKEDVTSGENTIDFKLSSKESFSSE